MLNPPIIKKIAHANKRFFLFSFLFSSIILFIRWSMLGLDEMGFSLDKSFLAINNELFFSGKFDIKYNIKQKNNINHSSWDHYGFNST